MYYTERKPKNKKRGRPGNEARAFLDQLFCVVYLLGSEGVHIVPTIRRHQLGDVISLIHGTRDKANIPHHFSISINLHVNKNLSWVIM